ncbi:3-hydroxyisobutyrate dehydrogenase-like beta-hydroxyacid dehydrogenase [Prauserella shujinwangii]|uniref:3-hydroxyisobutyrate dehydrogenase-like beta-hydroxyacid dehydrogenase n=1 Tax=Prauserella shujinwangii TaxID=1453103 RepID=A0A2T0LP41_9PSEU|nr:3-hydroxyisobutyrate dehydrogenase-like beta-hydroxyacid dehydrogenase [Prauserella shujinwangii]
MTEQHKPAVSVLGLGAMGTALAEALLAAGHPTTVWNRTPARTDPLVAKGAARAADVGEAVSASRLVLVCLLDHPSVHSALDPAADRLRGRALVNLTSGTPAQAEELATWASCHGADFLDGGIMAVPPMIGKPGAFVLYSGSRDAFDAYRGTLDVLADSRYLGTEPGRAALYDTALLSGMYGMFMGILHALALVTADGTAAGEFAPMLREWLDAMSGFATSAAEQIDRADYALGVVSSLAMQATGFDEFLDVARERGVSPELLAPLGPLLRRRVADGHGHEDITGVIELLRTGSAG